VSAPPTPTPPPHPEQQPPPPLPPLIFQPNPDSRLDQLLSQYETRKARVDRDVKELKGITEAIKAELNRQLPGREVTVTSPSLTGGPLRYFPQPRTSVDRKWLEAHYPTIARQALKRETVWYLGRL
jgi:hypothetical protein